MIEPYYTEPGITLYHGDMLAVLPTLPENSVDACVTDPPYGLGFMGRDWDHGVPGVPFWSAVLRVLKPGAHLVAFGGTRTSHRLVCAIEDAGFEVRDSIGFLGTLGWVYGSGFPKSVDVQYQVMLESGVCLSSDPAPHAVVSSQFTPLRSVEAKGDFAVAPARILPGGSRGLLILTGRAGGSSAATVMWLCGSQDEATFSNIGLSWSGNSGASSDPTRTSITATEIAGIIGSQTWNSILARLTSPSVTHRRETRVNGCRCPASLVTVLSSADAEKHVVIPTLFAPEPAMSREQLELLAGTGSNLKPAWEPICLARKPLIGTVAANVQRFGTGALNVDGCRIVGPPSVGGAISGVSALGQASGWNAHANRTTEIDRSMSEGRWPANVVLDEEAAAMLDAEVGERPTGELKRVHKVSGWYTPSEDWTEWAGACGDSGGPSRFFYTAKASRSEREEGLARMVRPPAHVVTGRKEGSAGQNNPRAGVTGARARANTHPTVKSLDLMRWLCRLVTPPGGTILDPFLGSGTTGCAAVLEGFQFIGVEREAEYVEITTRRIEAARAEGHQPALNWHADDATGLSVADLQKAQGAPDYTRIKENP